MILIKVRVRINKKYKKNKKINLKIVNTIKLWGKF